MQGSDDTISVLHVDDEPDLSALLTAGMERESDRIRVSTEQSVDAGLARLREEDVDCVVSDYRMPERTGIDFLRAVREREPSLPFVIFAETGSETVASEAISAGVTDYVVRETIGDQHELLARKIESAVDHRRARRTAERTNRRLRELSSVADDVLWTFSADWSELLFINDAHEAMFGQPTEALYDDPHSFLDRVHPDDVDRVRTAMERAAAGDPRRVEYRVRQSESVEIWVESQCEPVVDDDGTVRRMTGFTRDITDRKVRERELASTNERLDEFAATVAHDLRNPVNIADGHVELAGEDCDSEHLDVAARALGRMEELLTDLLALARTGEQIGDTQSVDLEAVVSSAEHNVATGDTTVIADRLGTVECDATRVKEALENLFRNAIEHNESAVTITVGTLPDRDGFYVEDDGRGIPHDELGRVFDDGYTTVRKGTGLGLSIVEQIVEAHGWTIAARNGDDGGARFEIAGVRSTD